MQTRKKLLNLLWVLCWWIILPGCSQGKEGLIDESASIQVTPTQLTISCESTVSILTVKSGQDWTAYSDDNWINCNVRMNDGLVEISATENTDYHPREGLVVIKSGSTRITVTITQEARPEMTDPDIIAPEGYRLVWNDEFNTGNEPDLSDWYYETGGNGWGNNELQTYVAGSKDNEQLAAIENGILTLTAQKIAGTVYSIRINTRESWKYGYFEARIRLPEGKGTWPAFWMLPQEFTSWPDDGEIDIMEEVGYDPNVIVSTIHCKAYNHSIGTQKTDNLLVPTSQTEFHVYALEWTEDFIRTYVDGQEIFYFANDKAGNKETWPFDVPFYLKLNLAWGGNWGGAQGIDESVLPARYEIDYVRVFQKK